MTIFGKNKTVDGKFVFQRWSEYLRGSGWILVGSGQFCCIAEVGGVFDGFGHHHLSSRMRLPRAIFPSLKSQADIYGKRQIIGPGSRCSLSFFPYCLRFVCPR